MAKLVYNTYAVSSYNTAGAIIGIVMAMYVMAYTLPDAISELSNSTGYSADVSAAVTNIATIILPIMVIFACVMFILPSEVKSKIGL